MLSSRMVEAQQTSRSPRPFGIIRITALRSDPWAGVTELVTALVHRRPLKRMNGS